MLSPVGCHSKTQGWTMKLKLLSLDKMLDKDKKTDTASELVTPGLLLSPDEKELLKLIDEPEEAEASPNLSLLQCLSLVYYRNPASRALSNSSGS